MIWVLIKEDCANWSKESFLFLDKEKAIDYAIEEEFCRDEEEENIMRESLSEYGDYETINPALYDEGRRWYLQYKNIM